MSTFDPRVHRYLITDEGEVVIDEVSKHWAAIAWPVLQLVASLPVLLLAGFVPPQSAWVPVVIAIAIMVHAWWRIIGAHRDRFVITNMRVFRVHGILSQNIATMPISRILDITVHTPIIGRIFGYGHFVFESAAQEQGLREIRFVGSPTQRGLTIQRVIQRSGLRGRPQPFDGSPAGTDRVDVSTKPIVLTAPQATAGSAGDTDPFGTRPPFGNRPLDGPWWRGPA